MSNNEIETTVQTLLKAQILRAFNDGPDLIEKLIEAALKKTVNSHGGKPDAWDRTKMPYLDWLVGEEIRNAARLAVVEAVKERQAEIHAAIRTKLSSDTVVEAMLKVVLGALSQDYRLNITFADQRQDR